MGVVERELELAAEMVSISVVASPELVAASKDSSALGRLQDKLDDSKDRVMSVKKILEEIEDHEVTPELASNLDNMLERSIKEIGLDNEVTDELEAVGGVESLGLTLTPSVYIKTRLAGCESFLEAAGRMAREVTYRISSSFKETYILFTKSIDNLENAVDALERAVNEAGAFNKSLEDINLGSRLFNLFKINGKVSQDWTGNVEKLGRTISGLSNNYYLNSRKNLNTTISYFGGFENNTDDMFEKRMLMFHKSIPSNAFKECSIKNKEHSSANVVAMQSVELMGGVYFLDKRLAKLELSPASIEDCLATVSLRLDEEGTFFNNNSEIIFPKVDNEIKSLSSDQIKDIIKKVRSFIKDWKKVFENGETFKMSDNDFKDITKAIYDSEMSEMNKDIVITAFSSLVRKNQMELLNIRTGVNAYLVLTIAGLIELSNLSIKANAL